MNGILLSAGLGTRLRPYTDETPKPAIPFLSVPLACYPLALFEDHKIHNFVVNTHHLPGKIESLFRGLKWPTKNKPEQLIFSPEPGQILGSGGGIRQAIKHLVGRGTFFVANADEVILPNHFDVIKDALEFHKFHKGIATLLCIRHEEVGHKFGGVWIPENQKSKVGLFSKKAVPNHSGLHFVGVLLLNDSIKNYFFDDPEKEENILYETLTKAMAAGDEVHAYEIDAQWFESGNPTDFLKASDECLNAITENPLKPWANYLRQLICRCSVRDYKIEKAQAGLQEKMSETLVKLFSGEI